MENNDNKMPQVPPVPGQAPQPQFVQAPQPEPQPAPQPEPQPEPRYAQQPQPAPQYAQPQQAMQYPRQAPPQYNQAPPRYAQPQPGYGFNPGYQPVKPQKQPMSAGLKALIAILIVILAGSFIGFFVYINQNNQNGGFVEDSTAPSSNGSFTFPTENITEETTDNGKDYPESDAQKATDPSYKGLRTDNKPKKVKNGEYGAEYAFSKVEKSVVGVIGYEDGQEGNAKSYTSMGSGIVISKDGYIVTNSHIVNHSRTSFKLKIITADKKEYKAGVVGYDSRNDIAVLKAEANNLTPAEFGNSDELKVTEDIIVVGNPLGLSFQNSVTKGIVSALNREVLSSNNAKVIQTDAAINPGNSGGPMVNMYGQVVGIATAKIVLEEYEGMAFAIPGNTAKKIVDSIMKNGYVKGRVKIGIMGKAVTKNEADVAGIQVESISKGGPLDGKDIKSGDIITKVDGKEISTFSECYSILETHKPGDKIKVTVYHENTNSTNEIEIVLQEDKAE